MTDLDGIFVGIQLWLDAEHPGLFEKLYALDKQILELQEQQKELIFSVPGLAGYYGYSGPVSIKPVAYSLASARNEPVEKIIQEFYEYYEENK